MFKQPYQFGGIPRRDPGGPFVHGLDGLRIGDGAVVGNAPVYLASARETKPCQINRLPAVNHRLTTIVLFLFQLLFMSLGAAVATLDKVSVDLMVVLGTTTMPIHQVMRLSRGAIIELDATEQDEVKVLANSLPIASGVVTVNRNRIAVEVKQMLPKAPDQR
jgi:flagellar motor switch protein FliN/FliY